MGDSTTNIEVNLRSSADTSTARREFDSLFGDLKAGVVDALSGQGVDSKFISHVVDEFDRLNKELQETGATGEVVAQKIAALEQSLVQAAAAEEKRIAQLKTNMEMALHEKDEREEAAALQRRRREEDQLWMEQEGRRLQANTEKLEQEIMVRLKAERVAREAVQNTQALGSAMKGTQRDIGSALLVGAQFTDDLQYGLRAVMNQIPQMAAAFGLGAGVAGVIGIAAVAVNLLWDKFGGAKDAKAETEKVTASMDELRESLKRAGDASVELNKTELAKYVSEVESATTSWERMGAQIEKVLGYNNQLAAVQTKMANSQLEIERQNALGGANTEEEKKAINMQFDARKGAINGASEIDQARRNLDAEQARNEMLQRQNASVSGLRDNAQGNLGQVGKDEEQFRRSFADQSDQGRRVREADAADKRLRDLQEQRRKAAGEMNSVPNMDADLYASYAAEIAALKEQIDAAANERDIKNAGVAGDREAVNSGKGLTFGKLEEEAKASGELAKVLAVAKSQQEILNNARKKEEEALSNATKALTNIREEQAESERQLKLKKLEVQAAEMKDSEAFVKAGAAKEAADKEADEKRRQQQLEERARKLENDAKAAEIRGDPKAAEDLRRRAELAKLPDDATAEQRRKVEMDAQERRSKTGDQSMPPGIKVTGGLNDLAQSLGPAGKALADASRKLNDGATQKELQGVLTELAKLAPLITSLTGAQNNQIAQMKRQIAQMNSQLGAMRQQL